MARLWIGCILFGLGVFNFGFLLNTIAVGAHKGKIPTVVAIPTSSSSNKNPSTDCKENRVIQTITIHPKNANLLANLGDSIPMAKDSVITQITYLSLYNHLPAGKGGDIFFSPGDLIISAGKTIMDVSLQLLFLTFLMWVAPAIRSRFQKKEPSV